MCQVRYCLRHTAGPVLSIGKMITTNNIYSRLQEGTLTASRGRKAHQAISREVVELCEVSIDMIC